jgi:hypothetical protein
MAEQKKCEHPFRTRIQPYATVSLDLERCFDRLIFRHAAAITHILPDTGLES